jgi:hypothetical protein
VLYGRWAGRLRVYRASSLGYSLEALVAGHLGYAPVDAPEFIQKAYAEGHRIEPLAINRLRALGWDIRTSQDEVNANGDYQIEVELEVIPGKVMVVGHLDGMGGLLTEFPESVVEIKMMADQSWKSFNNHGWDAPGLVQKYKWQASAYMLATGLPHAMTAWNKDTEDMCTVLASEPFYTISDIANKLSQAEDFIARGVVPDGCTDFPCPYYYLHPPKDEVVKVEDETLESYLSQWLHWDREEKEAKKLKDEVRASILALAGDQRAAKVKGECGVTVETYWQNESEYVTKRKEGWVTRISGPRAKRGN